MSFKSTALTAALLIAATAPAAHAGVTEINAGLQALQDYNLIVAGTLNAGHETEGRTFVGGSIVGNSAGYNKDNLAGPVPGLTVVGDITGGSAHVWGDIQVGGSVVSGVEFESGPQVLTYGGTLQATNVNSPDTAVHDVTLAGALTTQRNTMISNLGELSSYLAGLATTDTVTFSGGNATFDATSSGDVAVFSIADLSAFANKNVQFTFPTAYDLVVVNVTGSDSMSTPGGMNFNGPSGLGTKVIWNFSNLGAGDTLTFNNGWYGSVLALGATGSNNTAIEGSMVFASFNQGGEVHTPGFGDYRVPPPGAVPEPATWAMMIVGFGAAGSILRRRRALAAA